MTEDAEDDVDELPYSYIYFAKASARVSNEIDPGKYGVLPSSMFVDFVGTLGEVFIVRTWQVICGK